MFFAEKTFQDPTVVMSVQVTHRVKFPDFPLMGLTSLKDPCQRSLVYLVG